MDEYIVFGGWTIAVEMMFYAVFPLLINTIRSPRVAIVVTFLSMLLAQVLRLFLNTIPFFLQTYSTYTFEFFPSQFPVFLIGITTFLVLKNPLSKKEKKFIVICSSLFVIAVVLQILFKLQIIAGHYLYGVFFGLIAYILFSKPMRVFVNAITMYVGKVSYSMYLCHVPVLWIMEKYNFVDFFPQYPILNFTLRFGLLLIFSTGIATVLFYLIERPGQLLGKKIIDHYEKRETTDMHRALETW